MKAIWRSLRYNFETAKAQLDASTARAAAWFDVLAVQNQQQEQSEQAIERSKAENARVFQESESKRADAERKLQAIERFEAGEERSRQSQAAIVDQRKENSRLRHKLMKWLSRSDTINTYRHAIDKQRENPTSCEWIFDAPAYKQWERPDDPSHALWIFAGPGTGKTVLTAQIVRRLRETYSSEKSAVLFFFCNGVNASKDTGLGILRTLLCQMLDLLPYIPEFVQEVYHDSYRRGLEIAQSLTFVVLSDLFCKTIDLFDKIHIVVDGIDEIEDRKDILNLFASLGRRGINENINVLVVSRRESDIGQLLRNFIHLSIHPSNTKLDIENFITITVDSKLDLDKDRAESVKFRLRRKARGMFIWIRLVVDILQDAATVDEFEEILLRIPQELHDLYCTILKRIYEKLSAGPESRLVRAKSIFKWLALSPRPLQVTEIQEALAVEGCMSPRANRKAVWSQNLESFRPGLTAIIEVCGTLVDETENAISLLHHTFREFLLSGSGFRPPDVQKFSVYSNTGNAEIGACCLFYLNNIESTMRKDFFDGKDIYVGHARLSTQHDIIGGFPLYEYACRQWPTHFGRCPVEHNSSILPVFSQFVFCTTWYQGWVLFSPSGRVPHSRLFRRIRKHGKLVCAWLDLLDVMLGGFVSQNAVSLQEVAEYTSDAPMLLLERFGDDRTGGDEPIKNLMDLGHAAERGHFAMVSWIVKQTSPKYDDVAIALRHASKAEHEETIWILCDYLMSMEHPSALDVARAENDTVVESILLKHIQTVQERIARFQNNGSATQAPANTFPPPDPPESTWSNPFIEPLPEGAVAINRRGNRAFLKAREPTLNNLDKRPFWEGAHCSDKGDHFARFGGHFVDEWGPRGLTSYPRIEAKIHASRLDSEFNSLRHTRPGQDEDEAMSDIQSLPSQDSQRNRSRPDVNER